jgi:glycosyltransferase involved in cell wall biosynthesis
MNFSHQPLVSIIMPCFNGEKTLPRALASLINQTHENWELVFIDDGSIDGSVDVVQAAHDPRIRIIRFERNLGRGVARQRGNEEAKVEFMAMLDADDWWYSTKLEKQLSFLMGHPSISLVGTGLMVVDHAGRVLACRRCRRIDSAIMITLRRPPLAYAYGVKPRAATVTTNAISAARTGISCSGCAWNTGSPTWPNPCMCTRKMKI